MARILVLTSRLPYPPTEGHQLRSWHLLRALASRHDVTLLSFRRRDDASDEEPVLRDALEAVHSVPIPSEHSRVALARALLRSQTGREPFIATKYASSAFRDTLRTLARDADVVHFDMLPLFAHVDCIPADVPIVLNAHNVEHQLLANRIAIERRPWARRFFAGQAGRLRAFEQAACLRADAVLACSKDDAMELRALAPATPMTVIPNGVDLEANRPAGRPPGDPCRMVFVGQMGWFPNRDGIEWFMRDVLPRIIGQRADARLVVVGKSQGLEVPEAVRDHVELAGFVPDLRPVVHDAGIYVVPLRAGSGTRLKVLEAMALGKAIVTTHVGSEGIALEAGRSALYADDAEGFAQAVLDLMDAPDEVARLGREARAQAERHYGWEAIGRDLLAVYDRLLAPRGEG